MQTQKPELPDTITAPRTDPIYNCHSYLTKVPIAAIKPFIQVLTKKGDTVADFFAGSGMTGLAALTLGRNAELSDISALGQHIAKSYLQHTPTEAFKKAGDEVIAIARQAIADLYKTQRQTDKKQVEMIRSIWSFTYVCPCCATNLIYLDHLDEQGKPPITCTSCDEPFVKRQWNRTHDVPRRIVVMGENGKQIEQAISQFDLNKIKKASKDPRLTAIPSLSIDKNREMYSRSGLGKTGMTETKKFFSDRNAIALFELWQAINAVKNRAIRQKLRFAFTAILPRASKRYQWSRKRPLNAQNQTYYIAPVYYEWNVFELFARKINAAIKATKALYDQASEIEQHNNSTIKVNYNLASADKLKHLDKDSVDYIFTDPPFGSNIF